MDFELHISKHTHLHTYLASGDILFGGKTRIPQMAQQREYTVQGYTVTVTQIF